MRRSGGDEDNNKRDYGSSVFKESPMGIGGLEDGGENENDGEKKEGKGSRGKGELDLATSNGSETEADEGDGGKDEKKIVLVEVEEVRSDGKEEKGNKKSGQGKNGFEGESGYFVECFPHTIILVINDPVVKADVSIKRFVGGDSKRPLFFGSNGNDLIGFGLGNYVDI